MTRSEETYRNWIKESEYGRTSGIYWMVQGMIDQLGEEEGMKLFVKQIYKMGEDWAKMKLQALEQQGLENTLERNILENASDDMMYSFAWDGGLKEYSEHDGVFEFTSCPIAAGFEAHGPTGVEIGEVFCRHIDNAFIQMYNSKYECDRKSSLNKDGLCRLHFKLKY